MFREGPFPAFLHGLVEYVGGGLFIALPLVLGYESGAATAVSIVIGVLMIGIAASTDWSLSLNNQIPKPIHFAIDLILAGVLIASPFLFGFSGETAPTAIFIVAGVLHLLLTIGTRFEQKPEKDEQRARSRSSSSKVRAAAADADKPSRTQPQVESGAGATERPPTGDRSSARRN
jgi:hypothetical protein